MQRESFYTGAEDLNTQEFYGYPKVKAHVYPYSPRAKPSNPVLRGAVVKFSSVTLPLIPGLPALFYKNAGWPKLQKTEGIKDVDARYDPIVIPFRPRAEFNNHSYTDPAQLQPTQSRTSWAFHSIADYHKAYKSGKTTPTAVVEAILPIILRDVDEPSHHSRAWLDSNVELIKASAAESTKRWKEGKALGVLDGVPIGAKDEADIQGYYKKNMGTTMNFNDPSDTTTWCVLKWEEAGAILMGKTNMHGGFACPPSN
jgi:Amidase